MNPRLKLNMNKVATITVVYILISLFVFYLNYAILHSPFSLGPSPNFDATTALWTNIIIGLLAGILGGISLVYVQEKVFRKRSFRFAILSTIASYIGIFIVVFLVAFMFNLVNDYGLNGISWITAQKTFTVASDTSLLSNFFLWAIISLITLFLLQVNDKFGQGMLVKFLAGSYHRPRKEERIFMFMDMRSSTTIAERIGNEQYFNLLNDLFVDITDTILNNEGEIYQYVGDEIVISWSMKKGIRKANCLKCYFDIQDKLKELRPKYRQYYTVEPEFKAGLHSGEVMAGEVGAIKRDIIYSGDVLNTTARIQEQCNEKGVDLLISKQTLDQLEGTQAYECIPLGTIELRGKQTTVELNTVRVL